MDIKKWKTPLIITAVGYVLTWYAGETMLPLARSLAFNVLNALGMGGIYWLANLALTTLKNVVVLYVVHLGCAQLVDKEPVDLTRPLLPAVASGVVMTVVPAVIQLVLRLLVVKVLHLHYLFYTVPGALAEFVVTLLAIFLGCVFLNTKKEQN